MSAIGAGVSARAPAVLDRTGRGPGRPRLVRGHGLWDGDVWHGRNTPRRHAFRLPLFMTGIDLDRLPELEAALRPRLTFLPQLARFRREHHLGDPERPLAEAARDRVEAEFGFRPRGAVLLLTHLSLFGFRFNPVSFYFLLDEAGAVDALLLEVNNTPWNEQHVYALDARYRYGVLRFEEPKRFHVSPFMGLDQRYRFRFDLAPGAMAIDKTNVEGGRPIFGARLRLCRQPFSRAALRRMLLRHPFMTARVFAGVYWQALRLWLKGVPYVPHPAERPEAESP